MAQSLRHIKSRIKSVENVKKITRAMEMVSVAKLKSLQNKCLNGQLQFKAVEAMLLNALAGNKDWTHPLLTVRPTVKKIALCLMTSSSGLCGNYNQALLKTAENFIAQYAGQSIQTIVIGRKGASFCRRKNIPVLSAYTEMRTAEVTSTAAKIAEELRRLYLSQEADEVYAVYTYFESASRCRPVVEKLFAITPPERLGTPAESPGVGARSGDIFAGARGAAAVSGLKYPGPATVYGFEPAGQAFLEQLIPYYVAVKLRMIFLNATAAEHAARVIAMGEANHNAKDMLEHLILTRNKIRQASITSEIIEIISSADALRE
ncbi:MAG: ATP synthase F1 subunit gamma [Candidatus Omnitrophica bacterium]|nr:ATP synthase F1 subunit gamma [Candidatus Omnitrophota bacterium]